MSNEVRGIFILIAICSLAALIGSEIGPSPDLWSAAFWREFLKFSVGYLLGMTFNWRWNKIQHDLTVQE